MEAQHDESCFQDNANSNSKPKDLPINPKRYFSPAPDEMATHSNPCAETPRIIHPNTFAAETGELASTQRHVTGTGIHVVDIGHNSADQSAHHRHVLKGGSVHAGAQTGVTRKHQQRVEYFVDGRSDEVNFRSAKPGTDCVRTDVSGFNWRWLCVVLALTAALVHTHVRVSRLESVVDKLGILTDGCKHETLDVQSGRSVNRPKESREAWPSPGATPRGLFHISDKDIPNKDAIGPRGYSNTARSTVTGSRKNAMGEIINGNKDSEIKNQQYVSRHRLPHLGISNASTKLQFLHGILEQNMNKTDSVEVAKTHINSEHSAETPQVALTNLQQKFGGQGERLYARKKRSAKPLKQNVREKFDQYCQDNWNPGRSE
ncbi:unnamed protein product [Lymnaea stagnalis]|uniref:Uncharacterized protein n=1 Tax=Lymnaea stagnalis TaxID=6523 RepID=A0AAV2HA45_LYMST